MGILKLDTLIIDYAARQLLLHIRYKKWPILCFLDKFEEISHLNSVSKMLSPEQIQQLIVENESLQVQLQEVNYILQIKEEEIAELKKIALTTAEMRSIMDTRLDELQMMQNYIGKQQQKAAGAEDRELELQQELTEAIKLQHQYNDLFQQYTYVNTQLADVQEELAAVKKKNKMLQQIAVQVGELESTLENLTLERDELKGKINVLENAQVL